MIKEKNRHYFFEIIGNRFSWNIITVPLQLRCSWFSLLDTYITSKFNDITVKRFRKGINSIVFAKNKAFQ